VTATQNTPSRRHRATRRRSAASQQVDVTCKGRRTRADAGARNEVDGEVVLHAPTFHDLRHTHGSALIAQGGDIEEVSARLGHRDTAITQRIYVHAFDAANRSDERRERLDRLYGNAVETTGRSKRKQTEGGSGTDAADLRIISDAA
jgi:integrase